MPKPKPKPIQISIPRPCTQSWEEMTPVDDGRHCAHCAKTVIDFTGWSDAALYKYLSQNNGAACGRFLNSQLDRPMHIPHQPHSRLYRMTIAMGLALMFTQTPDLLAQVRPPTVAALADTTQSQQSQPLLNNAGSIEGKAIDDKKEPLISATVLVFQDSVMKGGVFTDIDGYYRISPLPEGNYDVVVLYVGYDSVKLVAKVYSEKATVVNLELRQDKCRSNILGLLTITQYTPPLIDEDEPTKRTFTRDQIDHMPH